MRISRERTNFLKGLAISTVVLHHYVRRFEPEWFDFLGNHFVSFFFILSGLGIYFSLEKVVDAKEGLAGFYLKRAVRIYPLYWLSFAVDFVHETPEITGETLLQFLLLDFSDPPRVWFLFALIPCYILAPFLHKLLKKSGAVKYLAIVVTLFALINWALPLMGVPDIRVYTYKNIYLSQVLLFALGMLLPDMLQKMRPAGLWTIRLSFGALVAVYLLTSDYSTITGPALSILNVVFLLASFGFCAIYLTRQGPPRNASVVVLLGSYSYSIYLFHGMYFTALKMTGAMQIGSIPALAVMIILGLPALAAFIFLEELFNRRFDPREAIVNTRLSLSRGFSFGKAAS
jgi:peptidoglycan/LPS O-acetylase OafA/YrhL